MRALQKIQLYNVVFYHHLTRIFIFFVVLCPSILFTQNQDTLEINRVNGVISSAHFAHGKVKKSNNPQGWLKNILKSPNEIDFKLNKEEYDELGIFHQKYDQYWNDIKIEGAQYIIHSKGDFIQSINGNFSKPILKNKKSAITESKALSLALQNVNAKEYKWNDKFWQGFIKEIQNNPNASLYPKGELLVFISDSSKSYLCWKFNIQTLLPDDDYRIVYVDAISGDIISNKSGICHANINCQAQTFLSGTVPITGDSYASGIRLQELRNGVITRTFDCQKTATTSNAIDFNNSNTNWTSASWPSHTVKREALDVHWGMEKTLDYWRIVHNRIGFDNGGFPATAMVHLYSNALWNNAAWNPLGYIAFGDVSPDYKPLVSLDIVAHEMAHGLSKFTTGFSTNLDPAALNEGLSDIWAMAIEQWAAPSKNPWRFGEEVVNVSPNYVRNHVNPLQNPVIANPDTYNSTLFINFANSPHARSTVLSHWFYRLVNGGSGINAVGTTYSVNGISILDAIKIVYRAQRFYLTSNSGYPDVANAMKSACADLFTQCSQQYKSVVDALYAVNLTNTIIVNTINLSTNTNCSGGSPQFYGVVTPITNATDYKWYSKDDFLPSYPYVLRQSGTSNTALFSLPNSNWPYKIRLTVTRSNCPQLSTDYSITTPSCASAMAFPNPAKNSTTIRLIDSNNQITKDDSDYIEEVTIYDSYNSVRKKEKVNGKKIKEFQIDLTSYPEGVYTIFVQGNYTYNPIKLIKY